MSQSRITANVSKRHQLVGGAVAFLLATACIVTLTMLGAGCELGRMSLGLLTVALFVAGALSIGTSERKQV